MPRRARHVEPKETTPIARDEDRHRYFVAYVLRGRAAAEVDGLRRALASTELERIPPHLTLVPPVNVGPGRVVDAYRLLTDAAARTRPFVVELGPPGTFEPAHHVCYLRVGGDTETVAALRERCYRDPLVPATGREERGFVPHVTLSSHTEATTLDHAIAALRGFRHTVEIDRISLLRTAAGDPERRWAIVDEVLLAGVLLARRGGEEITLVGAAVWNTEDRDLLERNGSTTLTEGRRFDLVLRAFVEGVEVGLLALDWHGPTATISQLMVDAGLRRHGIGRHLVAHAERIARERSLGSVQVTVPPDAVSFFASCGYVHLAAAITAGEVMIRQTSA